MVQVMIRLQNHGRRNHPYWWIVVQPKNKNFRGKILEKVGIWSPRSTKTVDRAISVNKYKLKYWLSVGAKPTDGAHRLLYFSGLLPKKPISYGSKYLYEPEKKPYTMQFFHKHRWGLNATESANVHHYEKIKQMENILKAKLQIDNEAINEIIRPRDLNFKKEKTDYNTDMNTDDINSDDFDFYSRKRNFDLISKKLNNYFEEKYKLYRGNDYKYNNYLRKLEKLSKHQSLDQEGFKEYLNLVKSLTESKNKVLENIGQHFLNELLLKESMKKEINEMIKLAKINFDKEDNIDNEEALEENKKFLKIFMNSSIKDKNSLLDTLSNGFKSAAREIFKLNDDETFTDKEFQDIKNLRIAKILIKLRVSLLNKERKEFDKSNEKKLTPEVEENSHKRFLTDVFDNLKSSKFDEVPIFDKELVSEIIYRNTDCENYDDMLFQNINTALLSTETFKKFKPLLFDSEFYGNENISMDEKTQILSNPNIYLLNNDLMEELINSLLHKLTKKYELNDIYRDEENDLNEFSKVEDIRLKRREKMNQKAKELKDKYGAVDLLYENFEDQESHKDIYEFRRTYGEEYGQKFDLKFKKDFRIVKPELTGGRYYTPEEVEEMKAKEEKIDAIKENVRKEIENLRLGLPETEKKSELSEEDKILEDEIRSELTLETFKNNKNLSFIPLPDENRPVIDFKPYISIYRRKFKKEPKAPHQDEILKLNKEHLRKNKILANSIQETRAIPLLRQKEMMNRFLELFGRYSDTMYPEGFRHYENFELYQSVFPTRNVAEYQTDLNTFCDFDTFVEISYGSINHLKKLALIGLEFPELFHLTEFLSIYIKSKSSQFITQILKSYYKGYLSNFEKINIKFKLIDALEQAAAFNFAESLIPEMKDLIHKKQIEESVGEKYVYNKFTMASFPNLQERGEDMNLSRQGPFMPINPLKAHKANPTFNTPTIPKLERTRISKKSRVRIYKGFCSIERITNYH